MGSMDIRAASWHLIAWWVIFVLLYNVGPVATQTCQAITEDLIFGEVQDNQSISIRRTDSGALHSLYEMQDIFLRAVQPNPFPEELVRLLLTNTSIVESSQVVKYEAGYVTCAIIAILFVLFCWIFGIIFCVFQYRGRQVLPCRGVLCEPTPVFVGLLLILCGLFAGMVCTFYLNQKAHDEVGHGIKDLSRTLQDFRHSVNGIPQAIRKLVSEFEVPKVRVLADIERLLPEINSTVNEKITNEFRPLLSKLLQLARELEAAAQSVVTTNMTLTELQSRQERLDSEFLNLQESLLRTLSDPNCDGCTEGANIVRSVQLDQTPIPSFGDLADKLTNIQRINMIGIFQRASESFDKMPEFVSTQISRSIGELTANLEDVEQKIQSYASNLPIYRYLRPIDAAVRSFEEKATVYGDEVERYERYRWIVGIVVCCVLLLIITCSALGLLFGVWGLYLLRDPELSRRRRRDGTGVLLIGVYVTFLFSWLLILFVFITFLIGGNIRTLVCKHWVNGEIYKFLDDPRNLPNNIDLRKQIGLRETSNFTDMYNQCKSGSPIWDVLQINPINLDTTFNISQYTGDLENKINNFTVDLAGLNMMSSIAVRVLQEYNSSIDQLPFNKFLAQIEAMTVILHNVEAFVPALEALAAMQSNATIRGQLENGTATLRGILNTTVREQTATLMKLNNSLSTLSSLTPTLKVRIQTAIQDINTLKGPLVEGTIEMLRNEGKCLLRQALGYFSLYIEWAKTKILQDIASCRSVPRTLDNARVIVCDNVSHPWNGFWFCLGWSTILLIPYVFLSIKAIQHIAPKSGSYGSKEENLFPLKPRTVVEDDDHYLQEAQKAGQSCAKVSNPYSEYLVSEVL